MHDGGCLMYEKSVGSLIICGMLQLLIGPLLSIIHIYSVREEMRAAPVSTLNPQRTAMIVADFLKVIL